MEKFLEIYKQPRLNQEEMENQNRLITSQEIEWVIKNFPTKKYRRLDGFIGKSYQIPEEQIMPNLLKLFQKIKGEGKLPYSFYEASITLIPKSDFRYATRRENENQYPWYL